MRGRLFVIVLTVLALALLISGLGAAADRAAIRDASTGMQGVVISPTPDLDDLFGAGTGTPGLTGTPDTETATATVPAGSPTPGETATATVPAGSPTPGETATATVPTGSPTPQDMGEQQLVQILPQIYDQFECYDTLTTVRWTLENGSQGIVVVTGKVATDPLAERWDIIARRQGETAKVIEVVRANGESYARITDATGTSEWGNISPEVLQTLGQLNWIADLSVLLDVSEGEFVDQATINGLETSHYRYTREDFRVDQQDYELQDASADVWFSTEYNIPVKTVMNLEGTNILGTTGNIVVQSQLTDVNENCQIQLPQVQPAPTEQADGETELALADALGLREFESYRLQSNFDWTPQNARGFSGELNAQVTHDTPAEFASLMLQNVRPAAFPPYVEYVNYQGAMYLRVGSNGQWVSADDADLTNLIRQLGEAINPTEFLQSEDCELVEENVEINGEMTDHYRCVTENLEGRPFFRRLSQATVDIWRVRDSDTYVRMNMSVQAETAQGMSGVLNLRANVTDIGEPITIQEPEIGSSEGVVTPPTTVTPTVPATGTVTPTRTGTPSGTATVPASPTVTRTPTGTGTPSGTATLPGSPTITVTGTIVPENTPTSVFTTTQSMGQLPWDGDDNDDDINDDDDDDDDDDDMPSVTRTPVPGQPLQPTPTATQATPAPPATQQMSVCPLPFLMPCDNLEATYMVDASSQQVLQFYTAWMTQMGWTEMATQVENGVIFETDGQELLVTAIEVNGRTLVQLVKLTDGATPTGQ